jgi:RHS repeat-associated protein
MKLEKQVFTGLTLSLHKRYVGGIEYTGANLEGIYHAEGRLTPNGANFRYEYSLKDHLGNSRVSFAANGTAIQVLQENHYYPFGMEMRGSWVAQSGTENAYQYNGKELNEDFSLNWSDYGARWYDASVGRWNGVDPLAEDYLNWSPYNYVLNSPIRYIDPNGMNVIIKFSPINGKSHIEIIYTGVLIDKTGTQSQEQLKAIQDGIIEQLEESFTGESDEMKWDRVRLPFDVKIGKKMVSLGQKKWKRVTSASQMGALL